MFASKVGAYLSEVPFRCFSGLNIIKLYGSNNKLACLSLTASWMVKCKVYLVSEAVKTVASLLYPEHKVVEDGLAVANHTVKILKELGSDQIGDGRNNDDRMCGLRVRQGVLQKNCVGCFGQINGLNNRIGAAKLILG